jgi:hypothetical protein
MKQNKMQEAIIVDLAANQNDGSPLMVWFGGTYSPSRGLQKPSRRSITRDMMEIIAAYGVATDPTEKAELFKQIHCGIDVLAFKATV